MKQKMEAPLFIITIVLCISLLTSVILSFVYANNQYRLTSALTEELIVEYPNSEQKIVEIIKSNHLGNIENNTLGSYGFGTKDFLKPYAVTSIITAVACVIIFICIISAIIYLINKRNKTRIQELTCNLEQINAGKDVEIFDKKEDAFSTLQDEIYKTVTEMKIAKEKAVSERIEFAEYQSIGVTPKSITKILSIEALVIGVRPILWSIPFNILFVCLTTSSDGITLSEFLSNAPVLPTILFAIIMLSAIALSYFISGKKILNANIADVLKDDTIK